MFNVGRVLVLKNPPARFSDVRSGRMYRTKLVVTIPGWKLRGEDWVASQ